MKMLTFLDDPLCSTDFLSFKFQKKKATQEKSSEEKIQKLKKRNAELAAIARRLEEKAKQLQQENLKVFIQAVNSSITHLVA